MLAIFAALLVSQVSASHLGLGAQRLKNFNGGVLHRENRQGLKQQLQSASCENVTEGYFSGAVIDNFAPIQSQQRWYGKGQRYWLNKQFWGGENFPIFVFIGGEGEEKCSRLTDYLYMFDLSEEHRALMVDVEHRFYGQSIPTPDTSTKNMAMADLARIIDFIKAELNTPNSPVITIGGSYPGNLAAWFRLKYPSVTLGSIASSAPVIAQTNFPEYMDVVSQALIHFSGQPCVDAFKLAADIITNLALQNATGYAKLDTDFNTCSPMKSEQDLVILLSDLMGNVQGTIQYNNEHSGVMNVTNICATMTQSDDAYGNFVKLQAQYRQANGQSCEDANWDDMVAVLKQTGASRSWTYQTCNEFGYFQTTDSPNEPFHSWKWINLDFYMALCAAAFDGWSAKPEVSWINEQYGDVNIAATNVVFPTGTIDPWHALGVTNQTAPLPQASETKVFIENTAHCADLYAPNPDDPPSLTWGRQIIHDEVSKWLATAATKKP